jgi:hypothetical protein
VRSERNKQALERYYERKKQFRAQINAHLLANWNNPEFNLTEYSRELGMCSDSVRRYGYQLGLGRRYGQRANEVPPRPSTPRIDGHDENLLADLYDDRTYDDDPRCVT